MLRVRKQIHCDNKYTGAQITTAILDTGICAHPDFDNRIIDFSDFVHGRIGLYDEEGHGTHVAGILAGSGKLSDGKFRGIAPQCSLVVGKILDDSGNGSIDQMLLGLEWIMAIRRKWNIRILNISIGLAAEKGTGKTERLKAALEEIWEQGITVVVAAGNGGPRAGSMSLMGELGQVITVGCHEGGYLEDTGILCQHFSGREREDFGIVKPDIVAPGTNIISCNSRFRRSYGKWKNAYAAKSGTSMATPIVSGAAALLMQKEGGITNRDIKRRMIYSATDLKEPWTRQGWGMLDIGRMLN